MAVKTINLTGAEVAVKGLDGAHAHITNMGADIIYAAKSAGISPGADGVVPIPAGNGNTLRGISGAVYLAGTGSVLVQSDDYVEHPSFRNSTASGGSGVDDVARAAVNEHAGNAEIHVTTADKTAWNAKADLSDIPSSLPANGGNADTVGGKQASDFLPNKAVCVNGADYDSFTTSGFFEVLGNANLPTQNAPNGNNTSNNFYLLVQSRGEQYCNQIAVSVRTDLSVYVRTLYEGEWTAWVKINDGGNADSVNGHTVEIDVPADAKFTDTVYSHPTYTARTGTPTADQTPDFGGTFNITQPVSDSTGHITEMNSRTVKIPATTATSSSAGLMSSEDKSKLDGIADGATKVVVDSSLSTSSTNPVQNKIIAEALNTTAQNLGEWSSGYIKDLMVAATKSGFVTIAKTVTGMPVDGVYWYGFLDCNNANRCLRVTSTGNAGLTYSISYIASSQTWFNWHNVADGGIAASVGAYTEAKLAALEARIAALEGGTT